MQGQDEEKEQINELDPHIRILATTPLFGAGMKLQAGRLLLTPSGSA
jgi:hypothetical protein